MCAFPFSVMIAVIFELWISLANVNITFDVALHCDNLVILWPLSYIIEGLSAGIPVSKDSSSARTQFQTGFSELLLLFLEVPAPKLLIATVNSIEYLNK